VGVFSEHSVEGDWEVGLAEISVPSSVENVVHGRCYYNIFMQDVFYRKVTLSPSHHKHLSSLIEDMHSEQYDQIPLERTDPLLVKFSIRGGRWSSRIFIIRSPYSSAQTWLTVTCWVSSKTSSIQAIWRQDVCLLLLLDTYIPRGNVHQVFNPILYVPLQKKNFDTVEINIMTDVGVPVPFRLGKSFVVMEFRRAIHSYFGL